VGAGWLSVEDDGHVRFLTLDRPEKSNALHPDLIARLAEVLDEAAAARAARVVVLTGRGKRFCAGLDLKHLAGLEVSGRVEYMRSLFAIFRRLTEMPQPVIAAVNGPAIAGGFDLAAFCDLRLCSTSATFAQTEILLGLTQVAYPLYKVIGLARATELALTGEAIDADEAYRIGLVSRVHADDELLPRTLDFARRMAERPPEALFETKRLTREVIELDTEAAFTRMFDTISERLRSPEHLDALTAYMKRLASRPGRP
jgi:enoyl-CoA hydratase/carnithine racemase